MPIKIEKPLECHLLTPGELGHMIALFRQCRALQRDSDEWLKAAAAAFHAAATAFASPIESDERHFLLMLATPTMCAVQREGGVDAPRTRKRRST